MRVRTELGELYVEDVGQGPAVILWHSFLHHGGMWKAQVEALRPRFRTLVVDAPGHGRSSVIHRTFDMAECARAVLEVLDARDVAKAAMVGLSWGGMVAMELATKRPDRLSGIALFDTSCRAEPLRNRAKYHVMGAVERRLGAVPLLMDRVEKLFFCDRTLHAHRDVVDPWRSYVAGMDRESIWNALRCIFTRRDLTEALRRVDLPTLVGVGSEDRAQPLRESEWIAATIPNARLAVIPGSGHLSAVENPQAVNAVLLPFLDRVTRSEAVHAAS